MLNQTLTPYHQQILNFRRQYHPTTSSSDLSHRVEIIIPKSAHEVVRGYFDKAINSAVSSMNLEDRLEEDGCIGIDVGGMNREPDGQWVLTPVPASYPSKPTMILEVGLSESDAQLRRDGARWVIRTAARLT
jgi:hypothetical protein